MVNCKKCGSKISSSAYWGYCDKCNQEFDNALNNGAILIYKGISRTVTPPIIYWSIGETDHKKQYFNINQIEAIIIGKNLAKKNDVTQIIFEYSPNLSRWFLDEYLEKHPQIKEAVIIKENAPLLSH